MRSYFKKLLIIIVFISVYFTVLRPTRGYLNQFQKPKVLYITGDNPSISIDHTGSSVGIIFLGSNEHKKYQYKTPFGSFFLFGMIFLISLGAVNRSYIQLILLHIILGVISTICMWLGVLMFFELLIISDLISRYLLALGSFLIVILTLSDQLLLKGNIEDRK